MATAYPQHTEHGEDNFVLELNRVKDKVRTRFIELRECLSERESKLMKELNDILSCYNRYTSEFKKMDEQKRDIENTRIALTTVVATSPAVRTAHEKMLQELNEQLEQLETPVKPKLVTFVCDKNKLVREVNELCKLVERVSEIDYKSKTQSIISVCDRGTDDEQLNCPCSVTVDHNTGNIYVVDYLNNCVKVFDNTAKYVFQFGDKVGEGKMSYPRGINIWQNTVLVSQGSDCILVYQLDMESLFPELVVVEMENYNSTHHGVYQQMNTIMIFIFVILTTIVFKLSLRTSDTNLNSVKILFTTLVMSNSTKTTSLS